MALHPPELPSGGSCCPPSRLLGRLLQGPLSPAPHSRTVGTAKRTTLIAVWEPEGNVFWTLLFHTTCTPPWCEAARSRLAEGTVSPRAPPQPLGMGKRPTDDVAWTMHVTEAVLTSSRVTQPARLGCLVFPDVMSEGGLKQ